jgi:magnesium-transporting ATPase (P-type)
VECELPLNFHQFTLGHHFVVNLPTKEMIITVTKICLLVFTDCFMFRLQLSLFQFADIPSTYDVVYLEMSRRGARVLALGWKELGRLTPQQTRELTREELECDLKFAGFVVISCPLKVDSRAVVKEILNASHLVSTKPCL